MKAHVFQFDQAKADAVDTTDAVRLLEALRHPDEPIWLQSFADGPDTLYLLEQKTAKSGRPYTVKRWKVTGIPKAGGKTSSVQGITEKTGNTTLEQMATRPYLLENMARAGVFFCVNVLAEDAPRRKAEHVTRVAAVFLDLDGTPMPEGLPLVPTATVESSAGRHHVYWAVDGIPLDEFPVIQKHLAHLYSADPAVHDLPRVMRLPGYWHGKDEPGQLVRLTSLQPDAQYTRDDLLQAFPGLVDALATATAERERQAQDAERRREQADRIREQISTGTAGTLAEVQRKYGEVAMLGLTADLLAASEGQRNNTLNAVAYRAGRLIGAGFLDEADVRAQLGDIAEQTGLERGETETTLSSGLEAGKANPVDASQVGKFLGVKVQKKPSGNLEQAAARIDVAPDGLPAADAIPDPEGEGGSYSDLQIKELLGIPWPVVAADTEKAHAHRLHDLAGGDLGYVAELGGYVAWNGRQWLSGGKEGAGQVEAKRRVQGLGMAMQPEVEQLLALYSVLDVAAKRAAKEHGPDSREYRELERKASAMEKAYYAHARVAKVTESDAKQKAILSSARTLYVKDIRDFEPRPWVVGFQNGVWDRGVFREARREDHLLTLAAVPYQPSADRRSWMEVLDRITGNDVDLARTLQHVAGYALSGASSLRLLPWLYGEAGTGKSTFSELLATVLGEMAATIDPKLFAVDAARERLGAAIWGKRVALCAEAGNARLDAEALKTLSGGDRLSVRMLYAEGFTARASHVLVMVANDPPRVEAYDDALKDRVLALPFNHPLQNGAPLLDGRRLEELRQDPGSDLVGGFTSWAIDGLNEIYRAGDVHRAEVCRTATRAFWADVDPLHDFWLGLDRAELVRGISVAALRKVYEEWCDSVGSRPLGTQKFNKACKSVGLDSHSNGKERGWKLFKATAFPVEADQGGGARTDNFDNFDPISPKPKNFPIYAREEKGFRENGSEVVKVVSGRAAGWVGDDL